MRRQIVFTSPTHLPDLHRTFISFLNERIPCDGVFKEEGAAAITHLEFDENEVPTILCVVAMNNWTPSTCEGHIASDGTGRWMTRRFAHTVYHYVFEHAGRSRFNFVVGVNNTKAVTLHDKLGHKREAILEDAYGEDQDAYLYGLTKKQWKAGRFAKPTKE